MTLKQMSMHISMVLVTGLFLVGFANAVSFEDVRFLKISAADKRAVMKTVEGSLVVVAEGDSLGDGVTVVQIVQDKVIAERNAESGKETIIFRLDGKRQRVERFMTSGGAPPKTFAPAVKADSPENGTLGFN